MNKPLVYIASPYSHPDQEVRDKRYEEVTKVVARLCEAGIHTIPPITFNVPLAPYIKTKDTTWEYWKEYDKRLIDACDELWIVMLEGWEKSIGVRAETKYAMSKGMKIRVIGINETAGILHNFRVCYAALLEAFGVKTVEELND